MEKDEKLLKAEEKLKKAEALVKKLKNINERKARAEDTRKKVLAGAALLNFISKTPSEENRLYVLKILKANLNEKDFEYLISKM